MESSGDIQWEQMAEEARLAMRWAAAMEAADVGTRTLLAGMIRAEGAESAPQQLLDAFDCPLEGLFTLLQDMAPRPRIDPYVSQPAALFGMPQLSPNAALAREAAFGLRDRYHPDSPVGTRHLFAAILDNERCTAYRALAAILRSKVELAAVRELFHEQLLGGGGAGFRSRLRVLLPEEAPPASSPASFRRELSGHVGPVHALSFAPDGSSLASAAEDGLVRVWDLEGKSAPLVLDRHTSVAQTALAYTPDGRRLASGGADGSTAVWSLEGGGSPDGPIVLAGGKAAVSTFAFSWDGTMAIGSRSGLITIWSPELFQVGDSFEHGDPGIRDLRALAFAPGGERLVSGGAEGLTLWIPRTMEILEAEMEGSSELLALVYPSEDVIVAHDREGRTRRWDLSSDEEPRMTHHGAGSIAASFTADGSRLAIADADGAVRVGPADGEEGWRTLGSAGIVRSLALAADGETVASGGEDGEIRIWEAVSETSRTSSGAEWLSDRPTSADSFGRRRLAAALARRLERIGADVDNGSFLLHVDGPWGAGKSSLLSLLGEELEAGGDGGRRDWLVVRFDAWRQSRVGPPWWALLTSLREELGQSRRLPGRLWLRGLELLKLLRGYLLSSLLSLVVVAAAVALFLLLGPAKGGVAGLGQTISAVIAVATSIWLLARGAARALMWESAGGAKLYEQAEQNPMRGLADHFAWLIAQTDEKRVIFFIDDLDRCDEDYVVDLLESIQTLVRDAPARTRKRQSHAGYPPFFVVAADGRWIRHSYEHAYESFQEAVHEPGRRLGYLFLDKIFQLTLRIPEIGEEQRARYLDELLQMPTATPGLESRMEDPAAAVEGETRIRQSRNQEEILQVVDEARPEVRRRLEEAAVTRLSDAAVERATEHELQKFALLLEPNPRSMKRFVNAYSISLSTELLAGRLPDPEALALWTILRMRWPELADCLAGSPHLVAGIAAGDEPPTGLPEALAPLCGDAALAAVLAFGDGALSREAVETLG